MTDVLLDGLGTTTDSARLLLRAGVVDGVDTTRDSAGLLSRAGVLDGVETTTGSTGVPDGAWTLGVDVEMPLSPAKLLDGIGI